MDPNAFNKLKAYYQDIGKGNVRLSQSALKLKKAIVTGQTSYTFDLLTNQGTPTAEEIRLNLNDEFVTTTIGLFISGTAGSKGGGATFGYHFTYPPIEMDGVEAGKFAAFWQGRMKILINNINFLDNWDIDRHICYPRSQFGSFVAATAAIGSTQAHVANQSGARDGFYPLSPNVTLSGAKKTDITVDLPKGLISGAVIEFKDNKGIDFDITVESVMLVARGLLAQNAAKFQG